MALVHRAFLLDENGFRTKITPIVASLEAGDASLLFEEAVCVVEQTVPDQWPLRLGGDSLVDIRESDRVGLPNADLNEDSLKTASAIPPHKLGYWLLLVFSTFLQKCPGLGYDYSILSGALDVLGWDERDGHLLNEGMASFTLLKPGVPPVRPSPGDPWHYWHSMRPRYAYAEGWLPQEQVSRLQQHLLSEKNAIEEFDHRRFGGSWMGTSIKEPDEQLDYLKRLQATYQRALVMLETARQAGNALYMTLSYT